MKKLLCVLGAVLILGACSEGKQAQFNAIDITGADYAKGFALTDHDGQPRTLADFKGKVVAMFFGYTQCPDVCPTTMTEMVAVKQALSAGGRADGDKLQVLFVTVDPERDTPAIMKNYMAAFDPAFLALYASSPEQLAALAKDYKVYYKKVDGKAPGSYTMDHSAGLYLYDTQGRLRLYARYGSSVESLTADIRQLLK
ncbi:SCO family protein [Hylemonella gracilis]|uniref:Electron transport protein sco1/senc n=1 Tax=Hylemonella gracilis ATCC 19624 TaxID=887062 RepID=F3KTF0_9BURK|nr:SCO family protein [Hylemonella gracilis]EGI76829.1 electron transport protein sco1/senc [Hylemonella gracilis ATCC 19624]